MPNEQIEIEREDGSTFSVPLSDLLDQARDDYKSRHWSDEDEDNDD